MLASSRVALARGLVWRTATVSGEQGEQGGNDHASKCAAWWQWPRVGRATASWARARHCVGAACSAGSRLCMRAARERASVHGSHALATPHLRAARKHASVHGSHAFATPHLLLAPTGFSSTEGVSYAGEASDPVSLEPPENRVTTTKKVAILRTLSGKPRRELAPQGAGAQMLPPGCSMSDPSYTIKVRHMHSSTAGIMHRRQHMPRGAKPCLPVAAPSLFPGAAGHVCLGCLGPLPALAAGALHAAYARCPPQDQIYYQDPAPATK